MEDVPCRVRQLTMVIGTGRRRPRVVVIAATGKFDFFCRWVPLRLWMLVKGVCLNPAWSPLPGARLTTTGYGLSRRGARSLAQLYFAAAPGLAPKELLDGARVSAIARLKHCSLRARRIAGSADF